MYSNIISGTAMGIDGMLVNVEADISPGLPTLSMVGYLASSVKEAGERVRTAIKNSGFIIPASRITVNLSPADVRKDGAMYDLSIAMAILTSMQIIPAGKLENTIILGELGLSGEIKAVEGVLPIVHYASKQGIKKAIIPEENVNEALFVDDIEIYGVRELKALVDHLLGEASDDISYHKTSKDMIRKGFENGDINRHIDVNMENVRGQDTMKRGVMVAVAGFHNILMSGAAGAGKSLIARCIPGIMPPLSYEESLELTKIYSISGLMKGQKGLIIERPFRSPHHTVTETALVGGGAVPRPGEVSLADRGVLFLDELPEYKKKVIECLRQPMEDKTITISRHHSTFKFPSDFMLVAAMNPCPCGHYPDRKFCRCTENEIKAYRNKISYPILDRIDIRLEVKSVDYKELSSGKKTMSSEEMREQIEIARERQIYRFKDEDICFNSDIPQDKIERFIKINPAGEELLKKEFDTSNLSARGYFRIKRLARTVADLNDRDEIQEDDVYEAMFYRNISDRSEAIG
ncbi:magnesium chelatase family protein [Eubacterium ruminantium]|uniref:Magnesium chelatase family protein n=1 Tax=Eubacterium ruminantium TaxID=42322 RepID=A0A1T4MG13_9FIRM|nr:MULTISPECIES: YifB family Mg chelatase-like AAA ATPase [Eubacterium]MCR5367851.1 YifB family Mg chelatase-like AAA ATPase [Eubacterium sp.]SCW47761.1 magnesium chelatase family protein [Eubacterium ruminantium]SDM55915.1 magnesium chelatase family protein [Eubacterium ruminantium]SJZ65786.1 magnesium chelatase family protein [Eubacterium ruminantium]